MAGVKNKRIAIGWTYIGVLLFTVEDKVRENRKTRTVEFHNPCFSLNNIKVKIELEFGKYRK